MRTTPPTAWLYQNVAYNLCVVISIAGVKRDWISNKPTGAMRFSAHPFQPPFSNVSRYNAHLPASSSAMSEHTTIVASPQFFTLCKPTTVKSFSWKTLSSLYQYFNVAKRVHSNWNLHIEVLLEGRILTEFEALSQQKGTVTWSLFYIVPSTREVKLGL
ncbi:hypothetical protein VNO77_08785 [Canavalia gladiata]|uniref:Uncharacterized protein n=1 Tax=Canavalia gladiata TaxID=3824 RepID=A0AAN9QWQ7_CANGL